MNEEPDTNMWKIASDVFMLLSFFFGLLWSFSLFTDDSNLSGSSAVGFILCLFVGWFCNL